MAVDHPAMNLPGRGRRPLIVRLLIGAGLGLGVAVAVPFAVPVAVPAYLKLTGNAPDCPWVRTLSFGSDSARLDELRASYDRSLRQLDTDAGAGLMRFRAPGRDFWIRPQGENLDGKALLAFLLAELDYVHEVSPAHGVRSGDIVVDCGDHIGTYTAHALARGARRVLVVEPDPTNVEALRRNFTHEIAEGRVIVAPVGVWSKPGSLTLHLGVNNSGTGSMVLNEGGRSIEVPVVTLDALVAQHGLPRVDVIKMDIEGAEREALRGAGETLRRFRPRLRLDGNHRPDDLQVLPMVARSFAPGYELSCGPCEGSAERRLTPHILFLR